MCTRRIVGGILDSSASLMTALGFFVGENCEPSEPNWESEFLHWNRHLTTIGLEAQCLVESGCPLIIDIDIEC